SARGCRANRARLSRCPALVECCWPAGGAAAILREPRNDLAPGREPVGLRAQAADWSRRARVTVRHYNITFLSSNRNQESDDSGQKSSGGDPGPGRLERDPEEEYLSAG